MVFIDAHNYIKRMYHAGVDPYEMFIDLVHKYSNTSITVVCDTATSRNYRRSIHPGYKAGRTSSDDNVYFTVYNNIINIARHFENIIVAEITEGEADDYINSKAVMGDIVISNDKDLWPLVANFVAIYTNGTTKVDNQLIEQKFIHPEPEFILAYKSLVGDPSDKIPGKRGFGAAAYAKLSKTEIKEVLNCLANDLPNDLVNDQVKMSYNLAAPWSDFKVSYLSGIQTDLQDFLDANNIMLLE